MSVPVDSSGEASAPGLEFPRPFGDFELLEEIARGGMGIVYRARHLSLERIVAVKMLLFGPLSSPEFVKRFRAEASAAASLQHPNIVAIHEVGVHQGQHYFAMDYVEGQSLAKLLANGPLPSRTAATFLQTISQAIHYAHERGILHRDLKPSNVLIDANGQPRVTDFGLARRLAGDSELTVSGQVLGSPNYMPPEQATGRRGKISRSCDVYSLGAMLYHLLTGRPPFVGEALTDTLEQVLNVEPVSPRLLNPGVPRDLETLCLKCLEKEPSKRYPTAQALAEELGRFLNHEPILGRPVTRVERAWRWCRRKPALSGSLTAASLLLLAVLIGSPIAIYRINQAREAETVQRKRAEAEGLTARRDLYASDMNLAQQALNGGDLFRALQKLDAQRPGFGVPALAAPATKGAGGEPDRLKAGLQTDLRGWEWRYLWKQCQGEQLFILGTHSGGASAVGLLPDGITVFSAGWDNTVRLWDLESRRQVGLLPHAGPVTGAACSPDGHWLVTGTYTKNIKNPLRLWDLATRREAAVLATNFWLRPTLVFSPDSKLLAFADIDTGVHLWNVAARQEITNFPAFWPWQGLIGMAFSPDGNTLAYNQDQAGNIALWDIRNRSRIKTLMGHRKQVQALAFSPDGQFLVSGSMDKTIKLWNMKKPGEPVAFTNFTDGVRGLAFSPNGSVIAVATRGQRVALLDINTGTEIAQLRGHQSCVLNPTFTPDGRMLITGGGEGMMPGGDGSVRVWDATVGARKVESKPFTPGLDYFLHGVGVALCLSPDGQQLLTVFTNQTFSIWETLTLEESEHRPLPVAHFATAALAPGGRLAAFVARNGEIVFWNADTDQITRSTTSAGNENNRAAFSPDGKRLAIGGRGDVGVFDVADQRKLYTFPTRIRASKEQPGSPFSLGFSSNGEKLMSGFFSGLIKVWDVSGGTNEVILRGHDTQVAGLALLPNGRTLVSAASDLRFWDLNSGQQLLRLQPRSTAYRSCAVSPGGRRLAVGAADGLITIWDLTSQEEVATFKGHESTIERIAFLPDGNTLISASLDEVRVWRAASFEEANLDPLKK
jgi:WD40 repeat protein